MPPLTVSAPLVFRSDGTDPVRVKKAQLASGSDFSLIGGTPGQVLPGSDLTLLVTLTATQPGAYHDQLLLTHDGNGLGNSQVLLQGTVG